MIYPGVVNLPYWPQLLITIAAGAMYGILLGFIDHWLERHMITGCSLGRRILLKAAAYMAAFAVIIAGTMALHQVVFADFFRSLGIEMTLETRLAWVSVITLYTSVGNLLISFIKQVNRSFGPGVLLPLLLGRYRDPVVERRIFMFMDLRASTTYAEQLGHLQYSAMIRDLFHDVNMAVPKHDAEIYQYVGDEVVFTWSVADGLHSHNCLDLFFSIQENIVARAEEYRTRYGFVPEFKAGLHVGDVTAVEIGDIKREIAYHGDTVNTAARIQGVCNEFGRQFLASDELLKLFNGAGTGAFRTDQVGSVLLKGKQEHVLIHGVERVGIRKMVAA